MFMQLALHRQGHRFPVAGSRTHAEFTHSYIEFHCSYLLCSAGAPHSQFLFATFALSYSFDQATFAQAPALFRHIWLWLVSILIGRAINRILLTQITCYMILMEEQLHSLLIGIEPSLGVLVIAKLECKN